MTIESVTNLSDLDPALPGATDPKSEGDDHIRNLKNALLEAFAGFLGAVMVTGTDGGAANAYTLTPFDPLEAYGPRMAVVFSPAATNTGPSTLNISSLGAKQLVSVSSAPLVAGDLAVGCIYVAVYDGTRFRLASVTKNYVDQLAFNTTLPTAPSDTKPYDLVSANGSASWQPRTTIFDDDTKLAQTYALSVTPSL